MSGDESAAGSKGTIPESDAESVLDVIGQMLMTGTFDSSRLPKDPAIRQRLDEILITIGSVQNFALSLSKGDLDSRLEAKGISAGSLKFLRSNLKHLTWQAQQIATGDFSQRVDFMGEFSEAFNHMVTALDADRAKTKQRELELSLLNAQLLTEVTVRRQTEEALVQVNKKLNLLSSITRHDINNQLLALKAFLELSKEAVGDVALMSEYLRKEEKAANAIERQIAFTKEYQDLGVKDPVWQNVETGIKNALTVLPTQDIRVTAEVNDLEVYADPLFEKVFYNLIDNALRYGSSKMTKICITSQESEKGLVISIEDDGVGISADDKKRLFERGFGHNTGLGLFLSREILSITGITITETGEPGKGARFEIIVPKGAWRLYNG
jgi:signal transduction histidine kinase